MYSIEKANDGWKVMMGSRHICTVPSKDEALSVATILQADHDHWKEAVPAA